MNERSYETILKLHFLYFFVSFQFVLSFKYWILTTAFWFVTIISTVVGMVTPPDGRNTPPVVTLQLSVSTDTRAACKFVLTLT